MIKQINHLNIYSVKAPSSFPILRIASTESDKSADLVMSGFTVAGDLAAVVKSNFFRSVYISNQIEVGRKEIEVAVKQVGASIIWTDRLPADHRALWYGGKIQRGTMSSAVRSICEVLAQYRTLWRSMGQVAILEKPVGAPPWLRSLDISEIEILIDRLGVGGDETNGESGYILNRVAHAVAAGLASWLPPAGVVEVSDSENPPGYEKNSETIYLPVR